MRRTAAGAGKSPAAVKKIALAELKPGMYIADLCADWMDHAFVRNSFAVRDEATVRKVAEVSGFSGGRTELQLARFPGSARGSRRYCRAS